MLHGSDVGTSFGRSSVGTLTVFERKPDNGMRTSLIDGSHHTDLLGTLSIVFLVDANLINPERLYIGPYCIRVEPLQPFCEIRRDF